MLPTQTNTPLKGECPQIYHTFALLAPPKMGNLMIPVMSDTNVNTTDILHTLP